MGAVPGPPHPFRHRGQRQCACARQARWRGAARPFHPGRLGPALGHVRALPRRALRGPHPHHLGGAHRARRRGARALVPLRQDTCSFPRAPQWLPRPRPAQARGRRQLHRSSHVWGRRGPHRRAHPRPGCAGTEVDRALAGACWRWCGGGYGRACRRGLFPWEADSGVTPAPPDFYVWLTCARVVAPGCAAHMRPRVTRNKAHVVTLHPRCPDFRKPVDRLKVCDRSER
mmetsp:Transcript_1986/g.6014  ORF Transcript_1986/g.6014 Transcript_1986/m.6014 type:complete len:229 (-) Transcript_1986:60-746(-)